MTIQRRRALFVRTRLRTYKRGEDDGTECSPKMCRLHTEGTQHACGHYIVTRKVGKEDCEDKFCMNSEWHPRGRCPECGQNCKRYFDPDATQTVTRKTADWCHHCAYWFKGDGRRPTRP